MYTLLLSSVLLTQCPSPLIPFHYRFAFRSLIIDSFIQSVVCGEGVILFIRYMFCSYGLYHESACYLTIVIPKVVEGEMEMGRGGMDAVILPLFVGYWWCTQTVYPVASLFSFFLTSNPVFHWSVLGILSLQNLIYLCAFWFFWWRTTCDTRICLRRRERISIDFFDFFNWLMVGSVAWLHVVSVHPIIWSACSFVSWHSVRMLLQFDSFAHFFSLFYSFAFDVFDRWRVECRLSLRMSLLIFPFY